MSNQRIRARALLLGIAAFAVSSTGIGAGTDTVGGACGSDTEDAR